MQKSIRRYVFVKIFLEANPTLFKNQTFTYLCTLKSKHLLMKKITLFAALLMGAVSFAQLSINEVDADQTGVDTTEFLELLSDAPNFPMDGYIVVFYNGSNDTSYKTVDLAGFTTDANGFFIIGSDATPGVDIPLGPDNTIQNGADAIAIYQDSAANFPDGTPVTDTNLVDAIVYGTSDDDDLELLAGLNQTIQWDENLNSLKDVESIQKNSQGGFCVAAPTLRATNNCGTIGISEYGADTFQIFPNPAGYGFVNITSKIVGTKNIAVFDVLGKQVVKTTLSGDRLDISALSSGVYILQIEQGKASTTKKLVVK